MDGRRGAPPGDASLADNPDWADCYCWFPYHDAAGGDFDERTAAANREAMAAAIRDGQAGGYLAYARGAVVGWVNAAPRATGQTLMEKQL